MMTMVNFFKNTKKNIHSILILSTVGRSLSSDITSSETNEIVDTSFVKNLSISDDSYLKGNIEFKGDLNTKDIISKGVGAVPFVKLYGEASGEMNLNLNKDSNDLYKIIKANANIVFLKTYLIGSFIKSNNRLNVIPEMIYVKSLNIPYEILNKTINDNLTFSTGVTINYGQSKFEKDENAYAAIIESTNKLTTNIKGEDYKFLLNGGFLWERDNATQIMNASKKNGNFVYCRFFGETNLNFNFGNCFIPNLCLDCKVEHGLFDAGLKFLFSFSTLLQRDEMVGNYIKWCILLDGSYKKDLPIVKNIKANIGIGADADLSYSMNDNIVVEGDKQLVSGNNEYILFRPTLINFNASCDLDWNEIIKDKISFISDFKSSFDLKFEKIFGLCVDKFGDVESLENPTESWKSFLLSFTLDCVKTKINTANIENEKLKFFLDNLKLNIFKLSLGCSPNLYTNVDDVKKTVMKNAHFNVTGTLASGEFSWDKYGLVFKASILGDEFGYYNNDIHWNDIVSFGATFNLGKFYKNNLI